LITGLRLFAWVQWRRGWDADQAANDGFESPTAEKFADCDWCMERTTETTRRNWHCGFLPRSRWLNAGVDARGNPVPSELAMRLPGGGRGLQTETCPGYLIQRAEVLEAARASRWAERGQLAIFYRGQELTQLAFDAFDILAGAQNEARNYGVRESLRVAKQRARR
jgi:hypothetical protein